MTLGKDELRALADEACRAARAVGNLINSSGQPQVESKLGGGSAASQVVTDIDRRAERCILEILAPTVTSFDLAILSEERPDDKERLSKPYFWSIDPLDGTLPFIEGQAGYAVSIALVSRAGVPVLGVVFDPVRKVLYRAVAGHGYSCEPVLDAPVALGESLSVFADRSFERSPNRDMLIGELHAIADEQGLAGIDLRVGAGAVMNACYALETPPACYVKLPKRDKGGGSLWDFAATACLFGEAGASATDVAGAPLDLNRPDSTFMNHRGVIFATDAALAAQIRLRWSLAFGEPER